MPGYTASTSVDRPLSDRSIAYMNKSEDFVAHKLFPIQRVSKQTGLFYEYDASAFLRHDMDMKRAPLAESIGSNIGISTTQYACVRRALHHLIDLNAAASSDEVIQEEEDATDFITHGLLLNKEVEFATNFLADAGGAWDVETDVDATAANKWDATTGDPIAQLRDAMSAMKTATGYRPNKLGIADDAMAKLMDNANVISRLSGGAFGLSNGGPLVRKQWLADELGLEEVHVISASKATDAGVITPVASRVALLVYSPDGASRKRPCAGLTFNHDFAALGGDGLGVAIERIEKRENKALKLEGEISYVQQKVSSALGTLLYDLW